MTSLFCEEKKKKPRAVRRFQILSEKKPVKQLFKEGRNVTFLFFFCVFLSSLIKILFLFLFSGGCVEDIFFLLQVGFRTVRILDHLVLSFFGWKRGLNLFSRKILSMWNVSKIALEIKFCHIWFDWLSVWLTDFTDCNCITSTEEICFNEISKQCN